MKNLTNFISYILISIFLLNVIACTGTHRRESAGQYIDSSSITFQVKSKLASDPHVKSLPITVNSYKNTVQLSGFVHSAEESRNAERIAASVPGVKAVKNDLIIRR